MTTALIVISTIITVLVVAGLKDAKRQQTSFYNKRMRDTHFHY